MERNELPASSADPLRPDLRTAEAQLAQRLQEVCATQEVQEESTAELIRLEENLEDAAKAAKQAISLRRRARAERETPIPGANGEPAGESHATEAAAGAESDEGVVREFRDREGREWRVWPVVPHLTQSRAGAERFMGDFKDGWLAFEAVDQDERKRLPHYPDDWRALGDAGLQDLLERAQTAQHRSRGRGSGEGTA